MDVGHKLLADCELLVARYLPAVVLTGVVTGGLVVAQTTIVEVLPPIHNDQTELTINVTKGANEKNYDLEARSE